MVSAGSDDRPERDDVLAGREPAWPSLLAAGERVRSWASRHRTLLSRTGGAAAILAGAAAAALAMQPSGSSTPQARVVGLSIHIAAPDASTAGSIVAAYRIVDPMAGEQVQVTGVTGPFLSATRRVPGGDQRGSAVLVAGTPSCANDKSLHAGPGPYLVAVTRAGADGRVTRARLHVPTAFVDWGSAIREDCWARRARQDIAIAHVGARPRLKDRLVQLDVRLSSAMPAAVLIRAVDIADVSTVDPADSGVLFPSGERLLHVRVPVQDCVLPPWPQQLTWVVGPVGEDPAASFVTGLRVADQRAVTAAARKICEPPSTRLEVVAARVLPADPALADPDGIAIAIRLRIATRAARAALGPATRSLTSDARTALSHADIRIVRGQGATTLTWRPRCGQGLTQPPRLPMRVGRDPATYAVTLDEAPLAQLYARACGLPYPAGMTSDGWSINPVR
jgi:hypothetical protein